MAQYVVRKIGRWSDAFGNSGNSFWWKEIGAKGYGDNFDMITKPGWTGRAKYSISTPSKHKHPPEKVISAAKRMSK